MLRLLDRKIPMAVLRQFTSTFGINGQNNSDVAKTLSENLCIAPFLALRMGADAATDVHPAPSLAPTRGWHLLPETILLRHLHSE